MPPSPDVLQRDSLPAGGRRPIRLATRCASLLALALLSAHAAFAGQDPAAALLDEAASPLSLPDGQKIVLRNLKLIWSGTAKVGGTVEFEVARPVLVGGLVVIPLHTPASGTIVAIQKKRAKGRGARLAIRFNGVKLVNGQLAKLRGQDRRGDNLKRGNEILATEVQTLGFGAGVIPFILLQRGPDVTILPGTRFEAFLDGDLTFERQALMRAQATIPPPRQDRAEIYIYRSALDGQQDDIGFPITCGKQYLNTLGTGRYIHLVVPPGLYWLRAGIAKVKPNKDDPASFFQLTAEGGRAYYLKFILARGSTLAKGAFAHLEQVSDATGEAELSDTITTAWGASPAMTLKEWPDLQAQVTTPPKAAKSMAAQ